MNKIQYKVRFIGVKLLLLYSLYYKIVSVDKYKDKYNKIGVT